jgi:16S rRNA (guanine527-N7)-methyltransferase
LPGIPIAICRPDLSVTLLEPRERRAAFLRHAVRTVPVENARVLQERVESVTEVFDMATVRAVGRLAQTIGRAEFLKERGLLLAWTTDVPALEASLNPVLELEAVLPVPGSTRRQIARLRRRVPRGTQRRKLVV